MRPVIRLVRGLVSLVFVAAIVWCSFRVPLGRRTFAEHADRIGETPEARELLDSTRQTVSPMLQDATDRMLGEYIEAPTKAAGPKGAAKGSPERPGARIEPAPVVEPRDPSVPANTRAARRGRLPRASSADDIVP